MNKAQTPLVTDEWWQPLVQIKPGQIGLLVQPGSKVPAIALQHTWNWHWPLLTTVRLISNQTYNYHIASGQSAKGQSMTDEPIVIVTKDVQLISLQATLQISIDQKADIAKLALLEPKSVDRTIRPIIRQIMRQDLANHYRNDITVSKALSRRLEQKLISAFRPHAIHVSQVTITDIQDFHPLIPTSPA